jgi:hypothetical protein
MDENTNAVDNSEVAVFTPKIMARVTIYAKKDGMENTVKQATCYRNTWVVFKVLVDYKEASTPEELAQLFVKLEIINEGAAPLVLLNTEFNKAFEELMGRCLNPNMAFQILAKTLSDLGEMSAMTGVIVTAVFKDGKSAGIGFISDSLPVTETDISVLGEAAANQAEQFKVEMRKKGVKFPSDSRIIIPGGPVKVR